MAQIKRFFGNYYHISDHAKRSPSIKHEVQTKFTASALSKLTKVILLIHILITDTISQTITDHIYTRVLKYCPTHRSANIYIFTEKIHIYISPFTEIIRYISYSKKS